MKQRPKSLVNPARAEKVLVALDFSADSDRAVLAGLQFIMQRPVTLHLVHAHVSFEEGDVMRSDEKSLRVQMETIYSRAMETYPVSHRASVSFSVVRDIAPAAAVLRYASRHDIDLIVAGTHGRRGFRRLILGSVAEEIVRLSSCAVVTVGGNSVLKLGASLRSIWPPLTSRKNPVERCPPVDTWRTKSEQASNCSMSW